MMLSYHLYLLSECLCFVGGVFKLELFLPEEYPMAAPKVLFISLVVGYDD